jgi:hypothetical protein
VVNDPRALTTRTVGTAHVTYSDELNPSMMTAMKRFRNTNVMRRVNERKYGSAALVPQPLMGMQSNDDEKPHIWDSSDHGRCRMFCSHSTAQHSRPHTA